MSDIDARLRISVLGREELQTLFDSGSKGVRRFSADVRSELGNAGRELQEFGRKTASALGAIAGVGGTLTIAQQAKSVLELRDQVAGLAATAGLAESQIDGLRNQLHQTAVATGQFAGDLGEALNEFTAKTGDIDKGRQSLELFGRVATATRASAKDIAAIGADLSKLGITDQTRAFSILAKQSDVGAVELKDLVSQGPRLLAAFAGAGLEGEAGLRHGGALAQVFQSGTGSVERTSTAVEATFRDLAAKATGIKSAYGIDVYGRDRTDVLKDVITKTGGSEKLLRQIFGDEAFRGVQVLATNYRQGKGFDLFNSFANVDADGSLIDRKFQINRSTGLAQLRQSQIEVQRSSDQNFGGGVDFLAQNSDLLSSAYGFATAHPLLLGAGALAGKVGLGVLQSRFGGGGAGGSSGLAGGLLGAVTGGGMPVSVTNWPKGLGAGLADGVGDIAQAAAQSSKALGVFGLAVQNAGTLAAVFAGSFALGTYIDQKTGLSDKISGTSEGQIAQEENQEADSAGGVAGRELGIAKDLAAKVKAGKLDPKKAAARLLGFSRSIEKAGSNAAVGDKALLLASFLEGGQAENILATDEAGFESSAGGDALFYGNGPKKDPRVEAYRAQLQAAEAPLPGSFGPAAPNPLQLLGRDVQDGTLGKLTDAIIQGFTRANVTVNVGADGTASLEVQGAGTRSVKSRTRRTAGGT